MTVKKDKDIWGKLSDAAATAGKALGDEYQRIRLSHDIWLLGRDLEKAYARIGKIFVHRHKDEIIDDDELTPLYDEVDELESAISNLRKQRDAISPVTETTEAAGAAEEGEGRKPDEAEMKFMEDETIFFCPECGARIDSSEKKPKHCIKCGEKLTGD
jgi:rubrerythrin